MPSVRFPRLSPLLDGSLIVLTLARWLLPTEATSEGETLWIAGLWFLYGAVHSIGQLRAGLCRRWDAADLAVCAFVGGHVLSGLMVLFGAGDKRFAGNLLWEWLSLGVLWFGWRERLSFLPLRRSLLPVLLATAVTLSLWGLWQYFVWYPQMRAEYGPAFEQLQQPETAAAARQKLSDADIPTEGPSLELFRNRLLDSREPFGPFGLANTLGGILAALFVVGAAAGMTSGISVPLMPSAGFMMTALVAGCLYLTNSRTAWGGVLIAAGAGTVLAVRQRIPSEFARRLLFPAAVVGVMLLGAAVLAWIMQGEHGLPGPLKSLAYRAEYWFGSWRMLMTSPWLGVGLGQFREQYLPYRLPVSSEEIADPHNLLLDVWANGGALGLAGLLSLIGVLLYRLSHDQSPRSATGTAPYEITMAPLVGGFAFPVAILGQLVATGVWDSHADSLVIFGAIWLATAWLLVRFVPTRGEDLAWAGPLGALALAIHLIGAGGIGMPAVTEMWLLLIAVGLTSTDSPPENWIGTRRWIGPAVGGVVYLSLLTGWYFTAYQPTVLSRQSLTAGDALASRSESIDRAVRAYQQAARADDWSAEPWQRLADLEFSRSKAASKSQQAALRMEALRYQSEALRRSPFRYHSYLRQAEILADAARSSRQRTDWDVCLSAYESARQRHPTHVLLLTEYASAAGEAGDRHRAADIAQEALQQDEVNRRRGHTERFLPEDTQHRLRELSP